MVVVWRHSLYDLKTPNLYRIFKSKSVILSTVASSYLEPTVHSGKEVACVYVLASQSDFWLRHRQPISLVVTSSRVGQWLQFVIR